MNDKMKKWQVYFVGQIIIALIVASIPVFGWNDFKTNQEPVDYINPFYGTNGEGRAGRTIPGPYLPFGMVQLSPDTKTGTRSTNGYDYKETTIEGFSMNHMSGVGWHGIHGNFQVMPTTGTLKFHSGSNQYDLYQNESEGWRSEYSKDNETAVAGNY